MDLLDLIGTLATLLWGVMLLFGFLALRERMLHRMFGYLIVAWLIIVGVDLAGWVGWFATFQLWVETRRMVSRVAQCCCMAAFLYGFFRPVFGQLWQRGGSRGRDHGGA